MTSSQSVIKIRGSNDSDDLVAIGANLSIDKNHRTFIIKDVDGGSFPSPGNSHVDHLNEIYIDDASTIMQKIHGR